MLAFHPSNVLDRSSHHNLLDCQVPDVDSNSRFLSTVLWDQVFIKIKEKNYEQKIRKKR